MSDNHYDDDFQEQGKVKTKNTLTGKPEIHTASLMEIFDFNEATLNTNRNNFATNLQKEFLKSSLKNDADAMWLMLTIMLGTSVLLGLILRMQGIPMQYLVIGAGVIILPMLIFAYGQQFGARKDLDTLQVQSVQGKAEVLWVNQGTHQMARLRVNNHWFEIDPQEALALLEYDLSVLRVYYAENSKILLSAEVIPLSTYNKLKLEEMQEEDTNLVIEAGRKYDER